MDQRRLFESWKFSSLIVEKFVDRPTSNHSQVYNAQPPTIHQESREQRCHPVNLIYVPSSGCLRLVTNQIASPCLPQHQQHGKERNCAIDYYRYSSGVDSARTSLFLGMLRKYRRRQEQQQQQRKTRTRNMDCLAVDGWLFATDRVKAARALYVCNSSIHWITLLLVHPT